MAAALRWKGADRVGARSTQQQKFASCANRNYHRAVAAHPILTARSHRSGLYGEDKSNDVCVRVGVQLTKAATRSRDQRQRAGLRRSAVLALILVTAAPTLAYADGDGFFESIRSFFGGKKLEPVIDAVPYKVTINVVDAPRSLRGAITSASNLQSLRRSPPSGAAGLLRRARSDIDLITAALYCGAIMAARSSSGRRPHPLIRPMPWPRSKRRARSGPVPVEVDGRPRVRCSISAASNCSTPTRTGRSPRRRRCARSACNKGRPALSTAIIAAESRITDFYRDRGYALAKIVDKDITADHASDTVSSRLSDLQAGPRSNSAWSRSPAPTS